MRIHSFGCALALAACGATFSPPAAAQVLYFYKVSSANAVDLGTLGGEEAEATDINNSGVIVGWSEDPGSTHKAFLHNGTMQPIGPANPQIPSHASGVNDSSEVVGSYYDFFGDQPFYWHSGTGVVTMSRDIQGGSGEFHTYPKAINNFGRIVGHGVLLPEGELLSATGCGTELSLQWDYAYVDPQLVYCPEDAWLDDEFAVRATDVNNSGAIAGYEIDFAHNAVNGFIWKSGVRTHVPGIPAARSVLPLGINESGKVVGRTAYGPIRAFFWNGSAENATDLGALPGGSRSEAREINDGNFIAGSSDALIAGGFFADVLRNRAFLWHVNFGMYALPLPQGFLPWSTDCAANSLNNQSGRAGLIRVVGYCTKNGKKRAVRWNVFVEQVGMPVNL